MGRSRSLTHTPSRNLELCESRMAASCRFKGYGPEVERPLRKQAISGKSGVERLLEIWSNYLNTGRLDKKALRAAAFSASDVDALCKSIGVFSSDNLSNPGRFFMIGKYISAAINACKGKDFALHMDLPQAYLCYRNTKNVNIYNTAFDVCREMVSGRVETRGHIHSAGTSMKGGELAILGTADGWIGKDMRGGAILVYGDFVSNRIPGWEIGCNMHGGEIHIFGKTGGRYLINNPHSKKRIFLNGMLFSGMEWI